MNEFDEVLSQILEFRDARNWKQFHNAKDLAVSLSIEAAELLENFQWKSAEETITTKKQDLQDEIADVAVYLFLLCEATGIDLKESIIQKLTKNDAKYPVDKAFGKSDKYTEL